ncbi:MAG: hypothetical protein R3E66_06480 [bacterium]
MTPRHATPRHATPRHATWLVLAFLMALPATGLADPADCVEITGLVTNQRIDVYINWDSFSVAKDADGNAGGLSQDEVVAAVNQAMEQWNHSAAGMEFTYKGITTATAASTNFAVVMGADFFNSMWVLDPNYAGQNRSKYSGQSFDIRLGDRHWVTGDPALVSTAWNSPQRDLVAVLTHEFGHSVGIHHPSVGGVMSSADRRQLYEIDVDCAEKYHDGSGGDGRDLALRKVAFSSGTISEALVYSPVWGGSSGVTSGGGSGTPNAFRGAWMTAEGLYAEKYTSGLRYLGNDESFLPQAPVRGHRLELPAAYRDAIFIGNRNAYNYGDRSAEYFTQQVFSSSDGFQNQHTNLGELRTCTSLSGSGYLASCSAVQNVQTAYRIGFAYDDSRNRSVYVWAQLQRSDLTVNGDLRVAIGTVASNPAITGPAYSLGVRTQVAPGIACKDGLAGSNGADCMVAYTDVTDPIGSVRFKRFSTITTGGNHYKPNVEYGYHMVASSGWHRTASPLGLVYHNGKWRLLMKLALATGAGGIRVYSSTTGDTGTWSLDFTGSYTATGGQGVGEWVGSNYGFFGN